MTAGLVLGYRGACVVVAIVLALLVLAILIITGEGRNRRARAVIREPRRCFCHESDEDS